LDESHDAGVFALSAREGREIFITEHAEYAPATLHEEYIRDKSKHLPIKILCNYYPNDDLDLLPVIKWRAHANLLFTNWLNYFVYQQTPYYIDSIPG
jgi:homoserine O-succinyltransferase/O-acetyltransferase